MNGQVEFQKPTWQNIQAHQSTSSNRSGFQDSSNSNSSNSTDISTNSPGSQSDRHGSNSPAAGRPNSKPFNFASSARNPEADQESPKPIVTRQSAFGVPFSINPDAGPIREVQLHVSNNRGVSWSLYSRQLPTAREFPFRASADGEYWFAVKTVGTTVAEKKLKPELVIAIDSRRPNFNVSLKTDALGRMVVSWRAADENLDANSVRLAYQPATTWGRPRSNWQTVKIPKVQRDIKSVYEDEIAFYADTSNVSIDLQISISDKAGNVAVVSRRYNLPRTARLNRSGATHPSRVPNVAERISRPDRIAQNTSNRPPSTDPYSSFSQQEKDAAADQVGMEAGFNPGQGRVNQGSFTRERNSKEDSTEGRIASSGSRHGGWQVKGNQGFQSDFATNRPYENEWNNKNEKVPGSVSDPGFQNPTRLASSGRSINESEEAFSRGSNINRIPSGQYAKLSSSRKFELDYQVEHIQPDDISKLEIWVTEDAGKTWNLKTTDSDRQSPVTIEVDDDGVYGFRVRIQTIDGLESVQPTAGDSADVWVEIDTTRPSVELTSIPYGKRSDAGKLIINWRATDRRMAAKPVTLFYSVNLDGPWQIIVEKLENSGQFKWPVTDRIPRSVYLRIEARDAAGNKNYHQTSQPIDLSGLNPRGMIRGIRPIK